MKNGGTLAVISYPILGSTPIISGTAVIAILVGIMMSLIGVALAYIISSFFNYPEMKGWATTELGEVIKTVFIIGFLGFSIYFVDLLAHAMLGVSGTPGDALHPFYITYAHIFLSELKMYYSEFFRVSLITYLFFMQLIGFRYYFLTFHIAPFAAFEFIRNFLTKYIYISFSGFVLTEFQDQLLIFFKRFTWSYLVPLGVVLRAFPITRKTGSTLIAFGACGFFIYPLLLVMNSVVMDNYIWGEPTVALTGEDYVLTGYDYFKGYNAPESSEEIDDVMDEYETIDESLTNTGEEAMHDLVSSEGGLGHSSFKNQFGFNPDRAVELYDKYEEGESTKDELVGYVNEFLEDVSGKFGLPVVTAMYKFLTFMFSGSLWRLGLRNAMDAFFLTVMTSFTIYGERLAISLLLFILDVMIFLTAMKDISLAIGGDPGLLGFDRVRKLYMFS